MDRRGFLGLILAGALSAFSPGAAFAFSAAEHNKIIEAALFGREDYRASVEGTLAGDAVAALESAVYMCLDQYNGKGEDQLETLRRYGVSGLPGSICDINFEGNSTHRRYAHQGWNYTYSGKQDKGQNWPLRKTILVNTVKKVFGMDDLWDAMSSLWDTSGEEWADAFAAMLYYLHVLGDQIERLEKDVYNGKVGEDENAIKFALPHPDAETSPDITTELESTLRTVLAEREGDFMYEALFDDLGVAAYRARKIASSTGGFDTVEKVAELLKLERDECLGGLKDRLPNLLKKIERFRAVFG